MMVSKFREVKNHRDKENKIKKERKKKLRNCIKNMHVCCRQMGIITCIITVVNAIHMYNVIALRYFVSQAQITGQMLNRYLMFFVKNFVQNVKLIELWGKPLVPLHFVISKS